MAKNIIDKIWEKHVVVQNEGHPAVFAIDATLLHEVTSAQAFDMLRERKMKVFRPESVLATLDHSIPTRVDRDVIYDEAARAQVEALRRNAEEFGVPLKDYDQGQGIIHVIGPELGITHPGMTLVCGDSHTSTHGAFGALAFGVGTSELGHVLATGCLLQDKPRTMKVEFRGRFRKAVCSKDAILKLISMIGIGGANGHVIEYCGEGVRSMTMESRMTLCNMSIECGARAGLIAPDETTFAFLEGRQYAPAAAAWDEAVKEWKSICSDPGASYDREIVVDLDKLEPMVTWGIDPGQGIEISGTVPSLDMLPSESRDHAKVALEYTGLTEGAPISGTAVDWAFIGSCTNGRIEDLRIAASVLDGRRVSANVTLYVVPGSEAVMRQAESEGLRKIFESSGADFRMPGCSLCLSMNDDRVPPGKRCISTSNRNFIGRQGTGSITHLASPATVAASAIEGRITSPEKYLV